MLLSSNTGPSTMKRKTSDEATELQEFEADAALTGFQPTPEFTHLQSSPFRVRPKMNSQNLSTCDSATAELDIGNQYPFLDAFDGRVEILRKATVTSQPCDGPFDAPLACKGSEGLHIVTPFDDLHSPSTMFAQSLLEVRTGIAVISENMAQSVEGGADRSHAQRCAVPSRRQT